MKNVIKTTLAPAAIGPYSQGILAGDLLFISGQLPVDPKTGQIVTGSDPIIVQVHQSLDNIHVILEAAGMDFSNVVKTTVFIKNMDDFTKVNEVYSMYFKVDFPARSCVQVSKLPKDALVEIEIIAKK